MLGGVAGGRALWVRETWNEGPLLSESIPKVPQLLGSKSDLMKTGTGSKDLDTWWHQGLRGDWQSMDPNSALPTAEL